MLPTISIGPLSLPTPGLLLLLGLWVGSSLAERFSQLRKIDSNKLYNLILIMLISGFVGARLAFILEHPAGYLAKPLDMFALSLAASDPWGAAAGAVIGGLIAANRSKLAYLATLDALTPLAAVLWISTHLANFASGAAFGSETSLPWAINLWGATRHPVQLYEAAGAILTFIYLWTNYFSKEQKTPGKIFLVFLGLSCGLRLLLEAFHGDSVLVGSIRLVQIVAWGILAGVLYAIPRLKPGEEQP